MFGWLSEAAIFASRSKRLRTPASSPSGSRRTFSATSRPSFWSRARKTTAEAPWPSRSRISKRSRPGGAPAGPGGGAGSSFRPSSARRTRSARSEECIPFLLEGLAVERQPRELLADRGPDALAHRQQVELHRLLG